ncbi:MAG: iron ABC transporter permease [Myxococcales bacterium]|nr:MAG: iron ABC transporter permease [Myxococcales bacterium]
MQRSMGSQHRRFTLVLVSGLLLLLGLMLLATSIGETPINLSRAFDSSLVQNPDRVMLFSVRLPRVVMGALCGIALGVVGASLQALLKNPLADPYVLGTSGGAALGGTLVLVMGASVNRALFLPMGAFVGALAATAFVYFIATKSDSLSVTGVLLAGIVVNAFASAAITFIKLLVSATQAHELLFWLVGAIGYEPWSILGVVSIYVFVGSTIMVMLSGRMNLMSLGDSAANHLGVELKRIKSILFIATALVVGGVVSFCGMIGFVGLVVPHGVRLVLGPDHRWVVPVSAFAGGAFLVLADLGARMLFHWLGSEAPVGAVTAMIGCPLFLWLLSRGNLQERLPL